jgi:hypothetical protein
VGEVSPKLAQMSDGDFVRRFRGALVALYPVLRELDCLEDDTQPYDDYDRAAEALWHVLVERSLMGKYGLDAPPKLPPYGFASWERPTDGYVEVVTGQPAGKFRFVQFIGDRRVGSEPFNAVDLLDTDNQVLTVANTWCLEFNWMRD